MFSVTSLKSALKHCSAAWIILTITIATWTTTLLSQGGVPVYAERFVYGWVRSHGVSGQMFLVMDGVGTFSVDTNTWTLSVVPGAPRVARVLNEIGSDVNGDLLLVTGRDGSGGGGWSNRVLYRIDNTGKGVLMTLPNGNPTASNIFPCGNGLVVACDHAGYFGISSNGGKTWTIPTDTLACIIQSPYASGVLTLSSSSRKSFLVHSAHGTQMFPLPIVTSKPVQLGRDSIMDVIAIDSKQTGNGLCRRAINDPTKAICTKRLTAIDGTSLLADSVDLLSTSNGKLFALEKWLPGRLFEYVNGHWRLVGKTGITGSGLAGYRSFEWWRRPDSVLCYLWTDANGIADVRVRRVLLTGIPEIRDVDSGRVVNLVAGYYNPSPVSDEWTLFTGTTNSEPLLHSARHGFLSLSAMARTIDFLPSLQILSGFTDSQGRLLVLPISDCLYEVDEFHRGHMRQRGLRGELFGQRLYEPDGPILRSPTDYGLRQPWVDSTDVLCPGIGTRRYSRSGDLIEVLDTGVTSSVARLDDGTLVLGGKGSVILIRPDLKRDTVVIRNIGGFTPADTSCIVTSIIARPDGGIIAFCSGFQVRDTATLSPVPLHAGGIIVSNDRGRTWVRASVPQPDVWFLGAMRLPSGTLVASATGLIRDTLLVSKGSTYIESSNHAMDDRLMWRSTDEGRSWQEVLRQGASVRYFLVGGNGVIDADGSALMVTPTGLMASTDDGRTWKDREAPTADGLAQLTSIFRSGTTGPVYYFTTDGAYRLGSATSVIDRTPSVQHLSIAASYATHRQRWTRSGFTPMHLTNTLGMTVTADASAMPPAGVYGVVLSGPEGQRVETVCIVAEE